MTEAALRAIRRHGVATTTAQIATEAKVSKPRLFTYFGNKLGIALAVAGVVGKDVEDDTLTRLRQASSLEPQAVVQHLLDAMFDAIDREPEVFRYLISAMDEAGGSEMALAHPSAHGVRQRLDLLVLAMRPDLPPEDRELLLLGIAGFVATTVFRWLDTGQPSRDRFAQLLQGAVTAILTGP